MKALQAVYLPVPLRSTADRWRPAAGETIIHKEYTGVCGKVIRLAK